MPHFIIECSDQVLSVQSGTSITEQVHRAACSTGLFNEDAIQVRVSPFSHYRVGNKSVDFVHVFANILEGRSAEQKLSLSRAVVKELAEMFPDIESISIDIIDLEKGTGFNKTML